MLARSILACDLLCHCAEVDTMTRTEIALPTPVRRRFLATNVQGQGGFQSFVRQLQERAKRTSTLVLSKDEFQRLTRYCAHYGNGGWQSELRIILANWVAQHYEKIAA